MDDIRMRESLCLGVDWEGLCNTVWPGQDRIWDVCAGTPYEYQGDAESLWPTYDLDAAQALVDELDDEGKLRTLNLLKVTGRAGEAVAELVKTEIGNLGIDADLLIAESAVLVKTIRDEVNSFDIQFQLFHAMCAEDFDWVNVYYSKAGITIDGRHYGGISDPVLDGYTEQWRTVMDESNRVQLAQDFNERIAEMMWHMPLVRNKARFGIRDDVHNVRGSGTFRHGPLPFTGVWKEA
jgi:ABC-type transport system substrate-binding protein